MVPKFLLWFSALHILSGTIIEDTLEIQIDPRLPRSFKSWEMLSMRNIGFNKIIDNKPDNSITVIPVPNWELYAMKYEVYLLIYVNSMAFVVVNQLNLPIHNISSISFSMIVIGMKHVQLIWHALKYQWDWLPPVIGLSWFLAYSGMSRNLHPLSSSILLCSQ